MGSQIETSGRAQPVAPDREGAGGCNCGVELADRAGGGVSGVGKGRFAGAGTTFIQRFEVSDRKVDLAAYFDQLRRVRDTQRYCADRA